MKTSISPNRAARYEPPKQGLERRRFCTGKQIDVQSFVEISLMGSL